jgi:hypothetical protein
MEPLDLAKYHANYCAEREKSAAEIDKIAGWNFDSPPDTCFRNKTGVYTHDNEKCPVNSEPWPDFDHPPCPFERWDTYNDRVRCIDTAKFLTCYFRNPASACGQQILGGIAEHRFVHYYRCVLFTSLSIVRF